MLAKWCKLVAAALGASSLPGCLSCLHPIDAPSHEARAFCREAPAVCRSNVCIFLFNGADPTSCGNLSGVREYLNKIGFDKTYYGQFCHAQRFTEELHKFRAERPDARFVIIGFDYGADAARQLAESAGAAQVPVDLLVYLDPRGLSGSACCPGAPVLRVVNICAERGWFGTSPALDGAENIRVGGVSSFGIPTHPTTIDLLTRELTSIAFSIPTYSQLDRNLPPLVDPAPTPRAVTVNKPAILDEWDFLKPVVDQRVIEVDRPTPPSPQMIGK